MCSDERLCQKGYSEFWVDKVEFFSKEGHSGILRSNCAVMNFFKHALLHSLSRRLHLLFTPPLPPPTLLLIIYSLPLLFHYTACIRSAYFSTSSHPILIVSLSFFFFVIVSYYLFASLSSSFLITCFCYSLVSFLSPFLPPSTLHSPS